MYKSRLLFLLLGCISLTAQPRWFKGPTLQPVYSGSYHCTQDNVSIDVREVDAKHAKRLFGRPFKSRKRPNSIIPVRVAITNRSDKKIVFNKNDVDLPQVSNSLLAKKYYIDSEIPFTTGCYISGALAPMGLMFGLVGLFLLIPGNIVGFAVAETVAFGLTVLPVRVGLNARDMIESRKAAHKELWETLGQEQYVIKPGQRKIAYIFVRKKNYRNTFTVSLRYPSDVLFNVSL